MQTRLFGSVPYFSRTQLEAASPSRKDGIDPVAETRWRFTTSKLVKSAIKTLKLPDWVYETSMNYINRFFLSRSISKNDRHLVCGGAILLASKAQESPRSVQDVAYVMLQLKHANKQALQRVPDQTMLEHAKEGVVLAEQAMLFSVNFHLNVETHVSLARRFLEPLGMWATANPAPEEAEANQLKLTLYGAVMFFLNDSALTNLSLQYPNHKVAAVALVMAAKRIAATRYSGKELPANLQRVLAVATDADWFASKGLTLEQAADIEAQITELYQSAPAQPTGAQQQQRQAAVQQASAPQAPAAVFTQQSSQQAPVVVCHAGMQHQPKVCSGTGGGAGTARAQLSSAAVCSESPEDGEVPGFGSDPAHERTSMQTSDPTVPGSVSAPPAGAAHDRDAVDQAQPTARGSYRGDTGAAGVLSASAVEQGRFGAHGDDRTCLQNDGHASRCRDHEEFAAGDEQATSELQPLPPQQPGADAEADGACPRQEDAGCMNYGPLEDSANENCSPQGLTNGNASGSGGVVAAGQPEVSSRTEADLQRHPATGLSSGSAGACDGHTSKAPSVCGKRARQEVDAHGCEVGESGSGDTSGKACRLGGQ